MLQLLWAQEYRNLAKLFFSQIISQSADRLQMLALIALIAQVSPGSSTDLALIMTFTLLPVFFIQPLAGVLVDRWDHRKTLFICDFLRGAFIMVIPFVLLKLGSLNWIYAAVFVMFCMPRFYVPAKLAFIPELVAKDHLLEANSLLSITGMIAAALSAGGAFLVEYIGAKYSMILTGVLYLFASVILGAIQYQKASSPDAHNVSEGEGRKKSSLRASLYEMLNEFKTGFGYILKSKDLRFIIEVMCILSAAAGAIYVVLIVFIQNAFQSVTKDIGILAISTVAGLFLSVFVYGKYGKKVQWSTTIFVCLIFSGAILAFFTWCVDAWANMMAAFAITFFWGMTLGPIIVASKTVVHVVSVAEKRGQVFSAIEIFTHVMFLVAMLLSSLLAEMVSEYAILLGIGVSVSVVGVAGYIKGRGE